MIVAHKASRHGDVPPRALSYYTILTSRRQTENDGFKVFAVPSALLNGVSGHLQDS